MLLAQRLSDRSFHPCGRHVVFGQIVRGPCFERARDEHLIALGRQKYDGQLGLGVLQRAYQLDAVNGAKFMIHKHDVTAHRLIDQRTGRTAGRVNFVHAGIGHRHGKVLAQRRAKIVVIVNNKNIQGGAYTAAAQAIRMRGR